MAPAVLTLCYMAPEAPSGGVCTLGSCLCGQNLAGQVWPARPPLLSQVLQQMLTDHVVLATEGVRLNIR